MYYELGQDPSVPDELEYLLDEPAVRAAQVDWQAKSLHDVLAEMPQPIATEYGRAVVLEPIGGEWDGTTTVLALPFQQAWKPSMFMRAAYAHQAVAPESRMIVLPNNDISDSYYDFEKPELQKIAQGNLSPFFENQAQILEELGVEGEVTLSGYSMGALSVIGLAKVCAGTLEVTSVNADEAPTGGREPKALQKDFLASGGWAEQRAAIADAHLPALSAMQNSRRLALDYTRFGLASLRPSNKALAAGMARVDFDELLSVVREQLPAGAIKLGRVANSRLVQLQDTAANGIDLRTYTGVGTHKHATGDNVVAHALMMLDARRR